MSEQEMIERYIYEVTKRVPQDMREEITMELQSLIEDMREEEGITVEEVLQKLGNPAEFAKRYNDRPNYLIGPEYYDNYMWVLKLGLIGIGISAVVSALLKGITGLEGSTLAGITEVQNWSDFFTAFFAELFTTAINGAYSVIGIVTIIFGVLEWKKVKVSLKPEEKWNVGDLGKNASSVKSWTPAALPPVPDKRAVISRGDSIFSIIFIIVFSALLLMVPQLFGAFHYGDGKLTGIACVFNLDAWDRIVPLLIFSMFIGLVDEIVHLVTGYYCKAVMYSSIICNAIQIACSIVLLKLLPFWNPYFADKMLEFMEKTEFSRGDILRYWGTDTFNNIILAGICVISCIEISVSVYKTLRYAK